MSCDESEGPDPNRPRSDARRFKRVVRNMRRSGEVAAQLKACETGYGYRLVPVDVFNDAVELLVRFSGEATRAPRKDGDGT